MNMLTSQKDCFQSYGAKPESLLIQLSVFCYEWSPDFWVDVYTRANPKIRESITGTTEES